MVALIYGRRGGHTIIELGAIAVLLVVIAMFSADIGVIVLGTTMNERACRDASRAAAQCSDAVAAQKAAQAALAAYAADGYFVTTPVLNTGSFVYQDFLGSPPADTSPFVTVTTSTQVKVPAPIFLWGASFGSGGTMTFSKTYTFPIVKTQLYLN
jgi:Flp pilus assembly protein TadG